MTPYPIWLQAQVLEAESALCLLFSWLEYLYIGDRVCSIIPVFVFKSKLKANALIFHPDLNATSAFVFRVAEPTHYILVFLVKIKAIGKLEEFLVYIVKSNEVNIRRAIDRKCFKTTFLAFMKSALWVARLSYHFIEIALFNNTTCSLGSTFEALRVFDFLNWLAEEIHDIISWFHYFNIIIKML